MYYNPYTETMEKKSGCLNWLLVLLFFLLVVIISSMWGLIFAYPEMLLWNWIVPGLFNGPEVTYWQMVGIHVFFSLLLPKVTNVNANK